MVRNLFFFGVVCALLAGCNEPPLYGTKAREFLSSRGVDAATIKKLRHHKSLPEETLHQFSEYENHSVLHLVAANPGTPVDILKTLASRDSIALRTGVAVNRAAPIELLRSLRTIGKYTTLNTALARNPRLSEQELREMFTNGEALKSSFAMNPSCPRDIMEAVLETGSDNDRYWLSRNPSLPPDLKAKLKTKSNG